MHAHTHAQHTLIHARTHTYNPPGLSDYSTPSPSNEHHTDTHPDTAPPQTDTTSQQSTGSSDISQSSPEPTGQRTLESSTETDTEMPPDTEPGMPNSDPLQSEGSSIHSDVPIVDASQSPTEGEPIGGNLARDDGRGGGGLEDGERDPEGIVGPPRMPSREEVKMESDPVESDHLAPQWEEPSPTVEGEDERIGVTRTPGTDEDTEPGTRHELPSSAAGGVAGLYDSGSFETARGHFDEDAGKWRSEEGGGKEEEEEEEEGEEEKEYREEEEGGKGEDVPGGEDGREEEVDEEGLEATETDETPENEPGKGNCSPSPI